MIRTSVTFGLTVAAVVMALAFICADAGAQVSYNVNDLGDAGDANLEDFQCLTASGTCTLRAAIEQTNEKWSYSYITIPTGTITLSNRLYIYADIHLTGAGSGSTVINGNDSTLLFHVYGELHASGLRLQRGYSTYRGAIIQAYDSSILDLDSCYLSEGYSTDVGGAIWAEGAEVTITNCTFWQNTADGSGGAIWVGPHEYDLGTLTVESTLFSTNQAGEDGGAVAIVNSATTFTGTTFLYNEASRWGGAVAVDTTVSYGDRTVDFTRCALHYNDAAHGGGLFCGTSGGKITIDSSTFFYNQATVHGGGIKAQGSAEILQAINSTISNNTADEHGGGIYFSASGGMALYNCTIAYNRADFDATNTGDGGGIYRGASALPILYHTILAANLDASPAGGQLAHDCSGTLISSGYNVVGQTDTLCTISATDGDQIGSQSSPIDPGLEFLAPDGPTAVHHLSDSSPAIDAGSPSGCLTLTHSQLLVDQRGQPRPSGPRCDVGSVEKTQTLIFSDDFESGDTSAWDGVLGA